MNDKNYSRYQYSIFLHGGRDEQLVIRTDTFEELLEAKKNIDTIIEKRKKEAEDQKKSVSQASGKTNTTITNAPRGTDWLDKGIAPKDSRPDYCFIHKVAMKAREGKFGTFYSHWLGKDSYGKSTYCNGKQK